MKKNKALAAAMASLALTGMLHGCDILKNNANNVQCVYGPPPSSETEKDNGQTGKDDILHDIPEPVYGPPNAEDLLPEENVPEDVYGPPVIDDEPEEPEDPEESEDFHPEDNDAVAIYGPPEVMMD